MDRTPPTKAEIVDSQNGFSASFFIDIEPQAGLIKRGSQVQPNHAVTL